MKDIMLKDLKLDEKRLDQVIAISVFGSYHEECFIKGHSDIDIGILLKKQLEWEEEIEIEDYLESVLPDHFKYNNMHYTFINEWNYPFSELILISEDKLIIDEESYLDYRLGYSAFKRDRENLDIIREQNLKELEAFKYSYTKEKLQEKFSESKLFLVKVRECIRRNPEGEDDIIDEAMISYFNSFCEFIIDMCETYLVSTDNYIPNKSGAEMIELASEFGFISTKDGRKLQNIIKLRNRYTHDYYQRKLARERILRVCRGELRTLDLFLEISTEKITLVLENSV